MGWELAVIGGIVGGTAGMLTSYISGAAESAQAEYQAKLASRNARQEQLYAELARNQAAAAAQATDNATDFEAANLRRQHAFALSENRSLLGASGLQNSGSNLLFNIDNAITAAVDEQNTIINGRYRADLQRYEGEVNAYKHESQAANYTAQSEYFSDLASAASTKTIWQSGLGMISGAISGAGAGISLAAGAAKLGMVDAATAKGGTLFGLMGA